MGYNILYIEDQKNFGSYKKELEKGDIFSVNVWDPNSLEELGEQVKNIDLMIVDFRLKDSQTIVDGPAYAQALRTKNSRTHKDIPIILFSVEENITDYYKDYTSQDLFDFSIPKGVYLEKSNKYNVRLLSAINAYKRIKEVNFNIESTLGITEDFKYKQLDYRIEFSLQKELFAQDIHAFSSFIMQNLIRSIGPLMGEDYLSTRLGVSIDSPDWNNLKEVLNTFKYSGIYSDSYNRWWAQSIETWFKSNDESNRSLRRLNSKQRVESIISITGLNNLIPLRKIEKSKYKAKSSIFWTICKETKLPIDYIDGFELYERELFSWQEPEYLSFLGKSSRKYNKSIKPSDMRKIVELEEILKKNVELK